MSAGANVNDGGQAVRGLLERTFGEHAPANSSSRRSIFPPARTHLKLTMMALM